MTEDTRVKLRAYFRTHDISPKDIAERTGYDMTYLYGLLGGSEKMTDAAKFRFIRAFPEVAVFFLSEPSEKSDETSAVKEAMAIPA